MAESLKVVFTDWSGTLSTSKFWGHLEQPTHPLNHLFTPLTDSMFGPAAPLRYLHDPWMRGEFGTEDVMELVSQETGIKTDIALREFIFGCQSMQFVSPEVPELIKLLRARGIQTLIATDNMDCFNRWTIPAMGLNQTFDGILNSTNLKAMKKDEDPNGQSLFFRQALENLNLVPGESMLIDDSPHNKTVAEKAGIVYRQIEWGTGLVPVLKELTKS